VNDRPDAAELLGAVERFLEEQVVPALEGPARYHARVAANVVRIVAREIATEEEQLAGEWKRLAALLDVDPSLPPGRAALRAALRARSEDLAARIRRGEADAGPWRRAVLAHLAHTVSDKLDVAQPRRPTREPGRGEGT
jgi:Domain of unknown function (DUF6285)